MANPYPQRFLDLLAEVDGPVLDDGSGGRSHPGVISLEYVEHPDSSVRADGHHLPFRDDSFALVLSQAVLEHVREPHRYVDEIVRVLRPGGQLWIEAAFNQPLHQEPWHFFNVTPYGLAWLCRDLEVLGSGVFGLISESWDWWGEAVGRRRILSAQQLEVVAASMRAIDAAMTPARLHRVAPAVWLHGRKPWG